MKLIVVVVCCVCVSVVSSQTLQVNNLWLRLCDRFCEECKSSTNLGFWCTSCPCGQNQEIDACKNVQCPDGQVCTTRTVSIWFLRRHIPGCVQQRSLTPTTTTMSTTSTTSTTTTTTTTTPSTTTTAAPPAIPVVRIFPCMDNSPCPEGQFCDLNGQVVGVCKPVQTTQQRSINKRCLEEGKSIGFCRAAFDRYFYNVTSQKCQWFHYGGCQGSENNFLSMKECERECGVSTDDATTQLQDQRVETDDTAAATITTTTTPSTDDDACSLPMDVGHCRAIMRHFYYNKENGKCELFPYGGCGGNKNNFKSKLDCEIACKNLRALP